MLLGATYNRISLARCWTAPITKALFGLALAVFLAVCAADASAAIGSGTTYTTATVGGNKITVYTYRPNCSDPELLFVFHGTNRNAAEYRDYARRLADRECFLVLAPLFDETRFPTWAYHRGGIVDDDGIVLPRDQWTVRLVLELVNWARRQEGRANAPYCLFGHSAGAQFLSRVAAFALPAAQRIVIANPSTDVLPSLQERAPYGLGGVYSAARGLAQLRAYLRLPVTVYLGEDDTGLVDLSMAEEAVRQGENRLDRGLKTFAMARAVATANGWAFGWRLIVVPEVGHSASGMLRATEVTRHSRFRFQRQRTSVPRRVVFLS